MASLEYCDNASCPYYFDEGAECQQENKQCRWEEAMELKRLEKEAKSGER